MANIYAKGLTRKEYMKEWGKEYRRRNKERINNNQREYRKKQRQKIDDVLGIKCIICGCTLKDRKRSALHEIHGEEHSYSLSYILNHIDDFVRMCIRCHYTLHSIYRYYKYKAKFDGIRTCLKTNRCDDDV